MPAFVLTNPPTTHTSPLPLPAVFPRGSSSGPGIVSATFAVAMKTTSERSSSTSRSEEHTSELQSRGDISHAGFCLNEPADHTHLPSPPARRFSEGGEQRPRDRLRDVRRRDEDDLGEIELDV